jgi:hypothetical protein
MLRQILICGTVILSLMMSVSGAWALKADCGKQPNVPAKPALEVNKEDVNNNSDYDNVVKENPNAIYLSVVNGDQPKPNACGLNPSNPIAEWAGWGGPLNADNMSMGEGVGSHNDIIIGGTLFERGVGTHAVAKLVYPLTGDSNLLYSRVLMQGKMFPLLKLVSIYLLVLRNFKLTSPTAVTATVVIMPA